MFAATTRCNLRCAHCDVRHYPQTLSAKAAIRFLEACRNVGINRVSFTGGEPFLTPDFLCQVSRAAVRRGLLFGRIMTNGAWHSNRQELARTLQSLFDAGYDGDLCVSVDAFHRQDLRKVASFIRTAARIWNRPDIVTIASVRGASGLMTRRRLAALARLLAARRIRPLSSHSLIKSRHLLIKIIPIDLSPIGKAAHLKEPWDGKWFRDDFCRGPGNVFLINPDGSVKPCCGYASDVDALTIGSLSADTPEAILLNTGGNSLVSVIFQLGLHPIRRKLESAGWSFPGRTSNQCFFCHYLLTQVPPALLRESVESLMEHRRKAPFQLGRGSSERQTGSAPF
jgi:hypothetical protein